MSGEEDIRGTLYARSEFAALLKIVTLLNARGRYPQLRESENGDHYAIYVIDRALKRDEPDRYRRVTFMQEERRAFTTDGELTSWLRGEDNTLRSWLHFLGVSGEDLIDLLLSSILPSLVAGASNA